MGVMGISTLLGGSGLPTQAGALMRIETQQNTMLSLVSCLMDKVLQ